ncbi:hypothetical protein LX87_00746 [Larkinella arboricola]|uniref:Pentapeptide MXKDX repeat protein n=1 Tax=Larkinella arboricola TaxID=643671 RepID=A0A327XEG8_LARAB|nr:hypothetical protein [Larkinella arboricola]RAK02626.1 hypothetical protein LX87_00746 [Larkinella arboricola]
MKKLLIAILIGISAYSVAGINSDHQSATKPSAVATAAQDTTRKQKTDKTGMQDRMRRGQIDDRRPTGDPDPKQLRTDSLRRGGAMKVDTVRK